MTTAELANYIAPFLAPARRIAEIANTKPEAFTYKNHRTYYLGANGRVSQRKQLVGDLIATVRACTTDHARFLFTEEVRKGQKPFQLCPKPYIGKPKPEAKPMVTLDSRGRVIPECWLNLSQESVQTGPSVYEVVR